MGYIILCDSCGRDVYLRKGPVGNKVRYCGRYIGHGRDNLPSEHRDRTCVSSRIMAGCAEMLSARDDKPWYEREDDGQ